MITPDLSTGILKKLAKTPLPFGRGAKRIHILTSTPAAAELVQLSEVLDGADHLRGVGVLVVVPGHDLHLIGVEATKPVFSTVSRLSP